MRTTRNKNTRHMRRLHESDGGISLSPTSVDTQIDSLLVAFEDDSLEERDDIMPEGISIRNALKKLLLEEKDEKSEDEDVAPEDKPKTDEPGKSLTPNINLEIFTSKVAMLIETYSKRLDVETVIFNRAKKYIIQNHGDAAADEFEELLSSQHDIDLRANVEDELPSAPPAKGAGPSL
jgi:hypothetical protein